MEHEKHQQKKHVQWDQEKLLETEKFRGTFDKIDQPKTPYRKNSDSDEEPMIPEQKSTEQIALDQSLQKAKANGSLNGHKKANIAELNARLKVEMEKYKNEGEDNDMEDQEEEAKRKRKEEFNKKRNQHYNEFQLVQKMKNAKWEDDDDEK